MGSNEGGGSKGTAGCGCFTLLFVLAAWGFCWIICPKLPDYKEVMKNGEVVDGKIIRITEVQNVTINEKHPREITYAYGEDQEATMRIAMRERVKSGADVRVRVLGDLAYPEDIRPFAMPGWLKVVLIVIALFGLGTMVWGILRLLVIGGVLFAAGREAFRGKRNGQVIQPGTPAPPAPPGSDTPPPPPPPTDDPSPPPPPPGV